MVVENRMPSAPKVGDRISPPGWKASHALRIVLGSWRFSFLAGV
jgi:hypothetical protein